MNVIRTGGEYADVLRLLNEAQTPEEITEHLKNGGLGADTDKYAELIIARKREGGGGLASENQLLALLGRPALAQLAKYAVKIGSVAIEPARLHFAKFVLQNPNYFGTIPNSPLQPVLPMQGNTTYEQLTCVGLNTPVDRLEAVLQVKQAFGYSGGICTNGSIEWVRFFVDLHDNNIWHDVGLGWVRVFDIGGRKPLCYAVYKDFTPVRKLCLTENIVKVRAILSWQAIPTAGNPNYIPVWGNILNVQVQIRPRFFIDFGDIVAKVPWDKFEIPEAPLLKEVDPAFKIPLPDPPPFSVMEKKRLYEKAKVPAHRYAFAEVKQFAADPAGFSQQLAKSPLIDLGLNEAEIGDIIGVLQKTDGNTTYEELKCVGLKPEWDMFEAVFTVKQPNGFSGPLCRQGSTEYVAFWADFFDGTGFHYMGTATMPVHDLSQVGRAGVQYAVYVRRNLSNYLWPCQTGARLVRVRAILSWEDAPPPGNPNWVPIWGNREECLVQIRPGTGKLAAILEVDDVAADDIDTATGRATGSFVEAGGSFVDAPFGQTITIAGTIGVGTDFFGGGAAPYKYRIEVKRDELGATYEPVINTFTLRKVQRVNGFLVPCAPGDFICAFDQEPIPAALEGGESGWYLYHEDLVGPQTQEILSDVLMRWPTNKSMEGRWKMRLHAKDSGGNHFFSDEVTVRIDNTAPTAVLTLTSAVLNGNPLPALTCGKFPVGTILSGTFEVHDPGDASSAVDFQHYRTASLTIHPAGPANGITPTTVPVSLTYNPPAVPTTGINGTWELRTKGMDPCGYVLRLDVRDRTIADAGNATGYHNADEFGFCLE